MQNKTLKKDKDKQVIPEKKFLKKDEDEFTKKMITRLNRIEGQVRGITKMLETDVFCDCDEVLNQIASVRGALNGVSSLILESHIKHHLVNEIQSGDQDKVITDFLYTLNKLLK